MLMLSCFVLSDSWRPHGLCNLPGLLCPWNFPGKNTGVGYHALLQGIIHTQGSNLPVPCLLHWQAGSFFTTSTNCDAHYIRYIVLINKFSREHTGLRQYTSIFLESCESGIRKRLHWLLMRHSVWGATG